VRSKPRVFKDASGWKIERQRYGFAGTEILGPVPSYKDVQRLGRRVLNGALLAEGVSTGHARTPTASDYRYGGHQLWPLEVI